MNSLPITETLRGRHLLFAGATGFVGKVTLAMLLERYPELGGIHVIVRPGSAGNAQERFFNKIAPSEPFQPIRDRYGEEGAKRYLAEKCHVISGDVTDPLWGVTPEQLEGIKGKVAAVINCAGLVSFDPSLEIGIDVNVRGAQNGAALCKALDAAMVHISTCFVVGNRPGQIFENEQIAGYFPKKDDIDGRDFSLDSELVDCERIVAQVRAKADDHQLLATFRTDAVARLRNEGRDPEDPKALKLAISRERKLWLVGELTRVGMERAASWGWPNTYTYTKSLGEQALAKAGKEDGLRWTTVRPAIVESALAFPFPGWNEGFTTSAPLTFMALKGQRQWPNHSTVILDIVPVDLVAAGTIAAIAAIIRNEHREVYQLASGDTNPLASSRVVELTGLYRRKFFRNKKTGSSWRNALESRTEPKSVSYGQYEKTSAPLVHGFAKWAKKTIDEQRPRWGAPTLNALLDRAKEELDEVEDQTRRVVAVVDIFKPFIWENRYVFRCDNVRELYARMSPEEIAKIPWDPNQYNWRDYWLNVHMPGMEKWVFPGLEEETSKKVHTIKPHRDLLEMFEATCEAHRERVALRMFAGEDGDQLGVEGRDQFTYGLMHQYAERVGHFLLRQGVTRGDRVMLLSENRPEWPIAYFGILKAGGVAVPLDWQLTEAEVINLARSSAAHTLLVSTKIHERLPELQASLAAAGLATKVELLPEALVDGPRVGKLLKTGNPEDTASLIFTSGTTGQPKGVMLTHRNFSALIAKIGGVFKLATGDGILSVLPLFHTFEFTCGMLTPLSRGAEITYIDEVTADRLGEALETGRITAMIGVPALWQLLHRKITQELAARSGFVEQAAKTLFSAHGEFRERFDMNLGKLLFWPVHRKFGGRLRYLVSGGSALDPEVYEAFHSLGFSIAEGYGLTETAPVLTVTPIQNKKVAGSVGKPLDGISVKLAEIDSEGIGEILARGPTVMAGYFQNAEATQAVMADGWLKTGDLGKFDDEGNLVLVGRKKDVIIDANGKNVYPDELEEVYSKHARIKELSIVGFPDEGGNEKVACLCVPDYGDLPRDEVRRELDKHFRDTSAGMPFYRRIKLLHFWDGTLPRTATRKVKRKLIIEELKKLEKLTQATQAQVQASRTQGGDQWLHDLIAEVAQRPAGSVNGMSNLASDLGFDSLMLTELSVGLEAAGVALPAIQDLTDIQTVDELAKLVRSAKKGGELVRSRREEDEEDDEKSEEIEIPEFVSNIGRKLLSLGQKALYESVFDVEVHGRNHIPRTGTFLVVANHSSHLDMGLVKLALGEEGERLVALAARDYFFNTPLKRAYFENFTNLIPMDRHGSLRESLGLAGDALEQGWHLLIFPEGTRSKDGQLAEFKPTTGYLSLTHNVDILPLHISGAHEALPKGSMVPKSSELVVRIGAPLSVATLREKAKGMSRSEAYRVVTAEAELAVKALAAGNVHRLDVAKVSGNIAPPKFPLAPRRVNRNGPVITDNDPLPESASPGHGHRHGHPHSHGGGHS